jgi:hypothetical protein
VPHSLRYNRVTKIRQLRDRKEINMDSIKSHTGIQSDRTIEAYDMKTQQKIQIVAQVVKECVLFFRLEDSPNPFKIQ